MTCNRIRFERTFKQVIRFRPNAELYPVILSQGCKSLPVSRLLKYAALTNENVSFVNFSDFIDDIVAYNISSSLPFYNPNYRIYYRIATHYKLALRHVFDSFHSSSAAVFQQVIILEDDFDLSADIFEYFTALLPIMTSDKSIFCASAWNDNGKASLVDLNHPELLHRTSFFPGLGWMLLRSFWLTNLRDKWPSSFWDDWLRDPKQRDSLSCIRPEISRVYTWGDEGSSHGQFYNTHLKPILLNTKYVNFSSLDLSYLLQRNFDTAFKKNITRCASLSLNPANYSTDLSHLCTVFSYSSEMSFKTIANAFNLMPDFRGNMPRTSYKDVVTFFHATSRIYVVPEKMLHDL